MKNTPRLVALFGILALLAFASCAKVGPTEEVARNIPVDSAQSLDLDLRMNAGELRLEGGASDLFEGRFRTNVASWKPEIDYRLQGTRGVLRVEQPRRPGLSWGHAENTWEMRLNDNVPVDLTAKFGAGEARVELGRTNLQGLDLKMGVGDLTLDLSGYSRQGFSGMVKGGVGHAKLYLPEAIGVRVSVHGGLGSVDAVGFKVDHRVYTNDAYGKTQTNIDLRIEAGIGSLELRLR